MGRNVITIGDLLKKGRTYLKRHRTFNRGLITELLLAHLLKTERTFLYEHRENILSLRQVLSYYRLLNKFLEKIPVAYLLGKQEFMSLPFSVDRNTLIPRAETETLVEEVLKLMNQEKLLQKSEELYVLDIGTGCGNIAVSVAKLSPNKNIRVFASDISKNALKIAQQNARLNKVDHLITFCPGSLFEAFKRYRLTGKVDFILSNPPYIPDKDFSRLPLSVKKYEPKIALYAGKKGTHFQEAIIKEAPYYLKKHGYLLFEIGHKQHPEIYNIIKHSPLFSNIRILPDCNNIPRVFCARFNT